MLEMQTRTHANVSRPTDCSETQTSRRMTGASIYTTDHGWLRLLPPLFSIWLMQSKTAGMLPEDALLPRDASVMLNNPPVIPFVNTPFTCRCRCLPTGCS
ncbi:hypothetical protein ACFX2A_024949 [Malus domestica]